MQFQTTLAFVLANEEGRLFRVKANEFTDGRNCLLWLPYNNPHARLLVTNLERFGAFYTKIQTLVPLGGRIRVSCGRFGHLPL